MVEFLFALIELSLLFCYSSGVMRRNGYSSDVFAGGQPLRIEILAGHQPFLASQN